MPAASASLRTATGTPSAFLNSLAAFVPFQLSSMFAAVSTTPRRTRPGTVQPTGPSQPIAFMTSATVSATASGVAGFGVGMRYRSASRAPFFTWTGAPLTPEPPMSIPRILVGYLPIG